MTINRTKLVVFLLLIFNGLSSQDVERQFQSLQDRIQNDPLRITGSLNAMGQYYQAFGIANRALPFNGRLMAALNFDLLGIKMPFSLAYSNGGVVFNKRLPSYSFIGISPSYKWAKVLIGTRSMDFGKYSFSNHAFTGGGFELTPGKYIVSAFYGRLRRARVEDFQGLNNVDPFFRRMGFGGKVGFEDGRDKATISLFKAWDIGSSLPDRDSTFLFYPGENVIVSGEFTKGLGPRTDLEVTYSNSGFTEDRDLPSTNRRFRLSTYGGLLGRNVSSRLNNAMEAKISHKFKTASVNLTYERIDPGYRTMGALFFNNDLQNISGGLKVRLLKSRLMINTRAGIQRNNLNGDQTNRYNRFVGSANVNLRATEQLTLMGSYSSFNNVNRRLSLAAIDTLVFVTDLVLSNENTNVGFNWTINNDNSRNSGLQGTLTFSRGNTIENDIVQDEQTTNTLNASVNYYLQLKTSKWNFGINTAYQRNTVAALQTSYSTVGFSLGKFLLEDRLNLSLLANYSLTGQRFDLGIQSSGQIIGTTFSAAFQVAKNSVITFQSGYIRNQVNAVLREDQLFTEFRNNLAFQYRFNPKQK